MSVHERNSHPGVADLRTIQFTNRSSSTLIAWLAVASMAIVTVAGAASDKVKPEPPPAPVTVVGGDVRVTGTVAVSGTVPVVVQNDLSVQGTVEVLNDVLYQPYVKSGSGVLSAGDQQGGRVSFDIPDGKRLVIENISIELIMPPGQNAIVSLWLKDGTTSRRHPLFPVQFQVSASNRWWLTGSQPFKLRRDAQAGITDEFSIDMFRGDGTDLAQINALVSGYLVDL